MKIFGPKSVSTYLFYLFRVASILFALFTCFVALSFATGNFESVDGRYKMHVPLLGTYIQGEDKTNVFISVAILLLFATVFLYMISNIFETFKEDTLFTKIAVKRMNHFACLNLIVGPFIYVLVHSLIMQHHVLSGIHNPIINILLGLLILYGTAVFKKGFEVQSEHDLTI